MALHKMIIQMNGIESNILLLYGKNQVHIFSVCLSYMYICEIHW